MNTIDKAPIVYYPNFILNPDEAFEKLRNELEWERRDNTPRCEYYCNDFNKSYIYGVGRGVREYFPKPYHPIILDIRKKIEDLISSKLEVCFLNLYLNQKDQLGWHADDSPEMDDNRPIAIVSFGVEREIWFRQYLKTICGLCVEEVPNHKTPDCRGPELLKNKQIKLYSPIEKIKLGQGSLCIMNPGMQETWQHRIPKVSHKCGERISLTFRGYVNE